MAGRSNAFLVWWSTVLLACLLAAPITPCACTNQAGFPHRWHVDGATKARPGPGPGPGLGQTPEQGRPVAGGGAGEKTRVFVVPHSHDDTGWLRTVDQYHTEQVRYILDAVVASLVANPARKFIQVEIAFFKRWWSVQPDTVKASVRDLVARGQLEFVNGGWTMADEGATTYPAVVNSLTLGHAFLRQEFNVTPSIAWHIDPFGASATFPSLFHDFGYKAFVINRIDYQLKTAWQQSQHLEFLWRGSASRGKSAEMFTHVLDSHYSSPYGFSFEYAGPGSTNSFDLADENPPIYAEPVSEFTPANVAERAQVFVEQVAKLRASYFRTPNVLIPFGNDFKYVVADAMYSNIETLMEYVNANSDTLGVTMEYATLSDYFSVVNADAPPAGGSWPSYSGDFFPYEFAPAGNRFDTPGFASQYSVWGGYFTSRQQLKGDVRKADGALAVAEGLLSAATASGSRIPVDDQLDLSRRVSALVTHHDAVTGTSVPAVVQDYQARLAFGELFSSNISALALSQLASNSSSKPTLSGDAAVLSDACSGDTVPVVLFNSAAQVVDEVVRLPLDCSNVAVVGWNASSGAFHPVPAQVDPNVTRHLPRIDFAPGSDPTWPRPPAPPTQPPFWLQVRVTIPAMGFTTVKVTGKATSATPGFAPLSKVETIPAGTKAQLTNGVVSVEYDAATGQAVQVSACGVSATVKQSFELYSSVVDWPNSDPYIFRPTGPATPVVNGTSAPTLVSVAGPVVTSILQTYPIDKVYILQMLSLVMDDASQACQLSSSGIVSPASFLRSRLKLGMATPNTELVARFETDLQTAYGSPPASSSLADTPTTTYPVIMTDSNGLEMQERVQGFPQWVGAVQYPYFAQPIAINYYPATSSSYIQDAPSATADQATGNNRRLTVSFDRSHGVAGLANGEMEVMLHRRCAVTKDKVPSLDDISIVESEMALALASSGGASSLLQRTMENRFAQGVFPFFGLPSTAVGTFEMSLLSAPLPPNIVLQTLSLGPHGTASTSILLRLRHQYAKGEHPELSNPVTLNLDTLLNTSLFKLVSFKESTLSGLQPSGPAITTLTINPMETKTVVASF